MAIDEYQHLRDSSDADRIHDPSHLWRPAMQGIPPRDTRDEDRAVEARRGANAQRRAWFDNPRNWHPDMVYAMERFAGPMSIGDLP